MHAAFPPSYSKCGIRLEYPIECKHGIVSCPYCEKPFNTEERSLESVIGKIDYSVYLVPNHGYVDSSPVLASHPIMDIVPIPAIDINPTSILVAPHMQVAF